jgi:hypothetical protein
MGLITEVRVRQPANDDLVGRDFVVAGIGAGFEGTIGAPAARLAGQDGHMWPIDAETLTEVQRELGRAAPEPWRPTRR